VLLLIWVWMGNGRSPRLACSPDLIVIEQVAGRTKRLEDTAAAAEAQNRAKLELKHEKLHTTMETEAQNLQSFASKAGTEVRSWWAETTTHIEQRRAKLRAELDQGKAERKVERAKRNAADAEDYAGDLVTFAATLSTRQSTR
jgi:uncharacterized small protein (DUF1192 family)